MKRMNDDAAGCTDKGGKSPATDLEWMVSGSLEDCQIAAGRAPLNELMAAYRKAAAGSARKKAIVRAIKHRFGAAPMFGEIAGGKEGA